MPGFGAPIGAKTPDLYVPPVCMMPGADAVSTIYSIGRTVGAVFSVPSRKTFRYLRFQVGVSEGTIRIAVSKVYTRGVTSASLETSALLADTGVIACPVAGDVRYDMGPFTLEPGEEYVVLYNRVSGNPTLVGRAFASQGKELATAVQRAANIATDVNYSYDYSSMFLRFSLEAA